MRGAIHDHQIVYFVVEFVLIYVMDVFPSFQWAAEMIGHVPTMLKYVTAMTVAIGLARAVTHFLIPRIAGIETNKAVPSALVNAGAALVAAGFGADSLVQHLGGLSLMPATGAQPTRAITSGQIVYAHGA